ncbi:beta-lactamase/transpeptidase-like protein [Sarocladium strictum]
MMYTVLTHLVEVKTGKSFSDFLEEHFFTPLGMTSTALQPSRISAKGLDNKVAKAHVWDKDKKTFAICSALESPEAQGAGCILSTAPDYLRWVKAMMKKQGPVTRKIYKDLTKARSITRPWQSAPKKLLSPDLYAAGLEVSYYRGYQIFGHDGGVDGFGSRHFWVPAFGLGCVVLGNGTDAGDIGNVVQLHLIDELLGVPEDERVVDGDVSDSGSDDADEEDEDETLQKAIKRLYPGVVQGDLELPLDLYTGNYWNAGYRGLTVQIQEDHLFIDANDRSLPLELVITHVSDNTSFIAH